MNGNVAFSIAVTVFGIALLGFVLSVLDWDEFFNDGTTTRKEALCNENGMVLETGCIGYKDCCINPLKTNEYHLIKYDYEKKEASFIEIGKEAEK